LKLAESFGIRGSRVNSPEALKPELERALAAQQPALIEVVVPRGSEADPWPFIHPAKNG
jgi:acetolactate synthase-1/2/3 large subunit